MERAAKQPGNVDTLALGFENAKQSARINVILSSTGKRDKHEGGEKRTLTTGAGEESILRGTGRPQRGVLACGQG